MTFQKSSTTTTIISMRALKERWSQSGMSHFAQATAKEINFVGLPRAGCKVEQGKPIGSVESGKWVGRLYVRSAARSSPAIRRLRMILR